MTTETLIALRDLVHAAEENLRIAKQTTGLLESEWRVEEARSIRDSAQRKYNAALRAAIDPVQTK